MGSKNRNEDFVDSVRGPAWKDGIMQKIVADQLKKTVVVLSALAEDIKLHESLINAAEKTAKSLRSGHKLLVAGNGGSAADAQHVVAEFVSRLVN